MIWKCIWAAGMIWTSYCIGHTVGKYHETMTEELHCMVMVASMIRGELKYALSPLCDVFDNLSHRTTGAVSDWLKSLSERTGENSDASFLLIWEDCIDRLEKESRFNEKQICQIRELGGILGYLDVEAQLSGLSLWEEEMQYEYECQREKTAGIKKTAHSLGILGGIFLVIIML